MITMVPIGAFVAVLCLAFLAVGAAFGFFFRRIRSTEEAKQPSETETQRLRRETKEIRAGTEKLRTACSPLSAPEAVEALIERLDRVHAEADHLDAQLDRKREILKASFGEKIRQAENKVKQLQLQNTPKDEIDKAQKELEELINQREEQFK